MSQKTTHRKNIVTHEEIMAVYEEDIYQKTRVVESKFGKAPFYDNFNGFSFSDLCDNLGIEKIALFRVHSENKEVV